jgi:seryl-tRNA synthetase
MGTSTTFLDALVREKILYPSGVPGIFGRSGALEDVIASFEKIVVAMGRDETTEAIYFPPGMSRAQFEASGYLKNFPQLVGTVHSFCGSDHDHAQLLGNVDAGKDWTGGQKANDVVLTPAACYPLYPIMGARGALPAGGATVALSSYCFRNEPSDDPARMQMFRQREFVRIGTPEEVEVFRETWMTRAGKLAELLMLPGHLDVANDPFFGRAGRMMASSQREQALKYELLIPVASDDKPTACMSVNYHQDHFGKTFKLTCSDGSQAHTACIGFGLERLGLALFRHHGFDVRHWPAKVRTALWS